MNNSPSNSSSLVKGRHFDSSIIILCVRWYITCKLSYRDLRDMMAERGVELAHTTILSWVQHYIPEFEKNWVSDKTNEIGSMPELLAGLILKEKLITMDALLTQRDIAEAIVSQEGDYVMTVKSNQAGLLAQVEGAIAGVAFYTQAPEQAESLDCRH